MEVSTHPHTVRRGTRLLTVLVAVAACLLAAPAQAQQQFQGWCAQVRIEISQQLTTERIGFEATLEVTNNTGLDPITDFAAALTFEDPVDGSDASDQFFVQQPVIRNINGIDGTGVIGPTKTAVITWFIIPKPSAGGTEPRGVEYNVGCDLAGRLAGVEIPPESLLVIPEVITVQPEPLLEITYFQPRDVQGDDPFTEEVESPIPFTLGVLVTNNGYRTAEDVVIESEQPRIVENRQGLLLIARLLGARVMDELVPNASLTVDLGDIPPGQSRKGAWDMITSLSGEFIEFKASYTHADELGGEETSIIESIDAHFIAQEVLNDEPGRDDVLDFLADTDRDPDMIPDALYETNGNILPVNHLDEASIGDPLTGRTFTIDLSADFEGWGYVRLDDPGQARYEIESVTRNDGKELDLHNVWTNIRYDPSTNAKLTYFNLFDRLEIGSYSYTVVYEAPPEDNDPPVTVLRFSGEVTEAEQTSYITRETQMYFTSEDENPVSIFYKVNNGEFRPGLPFSFDQPGEYEVIYYAEDNRGNRETESYARLVIAETGPSWAALDVVAETLFLRGNALSVRPGDARITATVAPGPTDLEARVEIFSGVKAFPVISGRPVSPTSEDSAELTVSGDHVDFYRYRVAEGEWSAETPAAEPITLTGLAGTVKVEVMARSAHGSYPAASEAVAVEWAIDAAAPAIELDGLDRHLVTDRALTLTVTNHPHFRWKLDDTYLRAPLTAGETFTLENLAPGPHTLHFQLADNADSEAIDGSFEFIVDPAYGSDLSPLPQVYGEVHPAVQGTTLDLSWDGRDDEGVARTPGWYTVRLTLADALGQASSQTRLVRIEDLAGDENLLAAAETGPAEVDGRGAWAVWQARPEGHWDIFARDLSAEGSDLRLTTSTADQRRAATDGRYAVWETRRENGNTDIEAVDLSAPGDRITITSTPALNESRPAVDWPWVVYESRPLGDAAAPRQLHAWNAETGVAVAIDPTSADQRHAAVHRGRVVWQDFRDPGSGEIYFADLHDGTVRRLTDDLYGQFFPRIRGNTIVWQDNRHAQVEIYAFDLLRDSERRLTDTPYDEAHPYLSGGFVIYEENSLGPETANLRLLDIDSGVNVTLTRGETYNEFGAMVAGEVVWQRRSGTSGAGASLRRAPLPAVQVAAQAHNTVPVTPALADRFGSAFALLEDWQEAAGVTEVTRFTQLVPALQSESASWDGASSSTAGTDFALVAGEFLWVRFGAAAALDLGERRGEAVDLPAGPSVLSFADFPDEFTAYALIESLGPPAVRAVRMLDARTGLWRAVSIEEGEPIGPNFRIPNVAVLLIDLHTPVSGWTTQP